MNPDITPYYVINKNVLDDYWDMLYGSLEGSWGSNFKIGYSYKTNALPWLIKYMKNKGAFAETVSHDEYLLAKYIGYDDSRIIYNGPYKDERSFFSILEAGGIVNIDGDREIGWLENNHSGKELAIGIRVNFELEKYCPGETTMGDESSRFGFSYEDGHLAKAISRLKNISNVRISGLHMHSSTKSRSVEAFRNIAQMACTVSGEFRLDPDYIDMGGGYCGGMSGRPEYPDYFPAISSELKKCFSPRKTTLIVEPGISMISKCTKFISSVLDVKDVRGTRYVITDGSRFNLDPTMIKNSYLYTVEKKAGTERDNKDEQIICGFSCMEADRLFKMKDSGELLPGDRIIYQNVGGYTMALNPLFIQFFPPVYVFDDKNGYTMVRRKWEPKDYFCGDTEI